MSVLASLTMSAQEELTVGDLQDSGCLWKTRGEELVEPIPTIVLTKVGNVLSVQALNYESNCVTADFTVKSNISGGSDSMPCSVNISVVPHLPGDLAADCMCPYNVSFTVRDVEANTFYLKCWWYEGLVTLEEGKPLVLEDIWEEATIDDVKYTLRKAFGIAKIENGSTQKGEYRIPSEVTYEGKTYSVTSIEFNAFKDNKNLTKVIIPKTLKNMDLSNNVGINSNPFSGCTALQSIEVEDGNPAVCAIDGVLFNKEKTKLLSYPADAQLTSYIVPESVTSVAGLAFSYSQHLQKVSLSDKVTSLGASVFYESKSVEEVRMPLKLTNLGSWMFTNCTRLKSVTIPQGVTSIGRNAFQGCTSLTSVTMPESVKEAEYYVFEGCTSLESVTLSPKLEHIMHNMFADCRKLKELIIPDSVTWIMPNAFKNCTTLKTLDLPKSVYRLGSMLFAGCKLDTLYIRGIIESRWMSADIFMDMGTQTKLYVQPSEVEKYKAIYKGPVYPLPEQTFDDKIEINEQNFPDKNFRNYVLDTAIDMNQNKVLDDDEILRVKEIDVHYKKIASLKGIEHFKELHKLTCYQNDLAELDLSSCTKLDTLNCAVNKLMALNLSNCSKLKWIRCDQNQLTDLDVSACTELKFFICSSNKITMLDISACRKLDDFECHMNNITKLDVSNNTDLIKLYCDYNQLTELDLSKNTKLEICSCNGNKITKLILSKDNVLNSLNCSTNQLYGTAMDHIVENLNYQQQGGSLMVFNADDKDLERNVITTNQVVALNAKGWKVYQWIYSGWSIYKGTPTDDYRPFVEDGKVWKVGGDESGNPVRRVEYYYFDGDTIIDGRTCKQMMCQRYVSPDHPDYNTFSQLPSLSYVGAWYEVDKKVYYYNAVNKQFRMMYDFSLDANDTLLIDNYLPYVVGPRQTGGIKGFKGVYRDVMISVEGEYHYNTTWLEGVGGIDGPIVSVYYGKEGHSLFLMSCTVGDEVIYLNDLWEDGATPEVLEARKQRIDFTHTIKTRPRAPRREPTSDPSLLRGETEGDQLYGEYNNLQLDINLNPLADAYQVSITDETGKAVYEKNVNAASIVGLNIDISAYPAGRYTVIVENSSESFTGVFDTLTTGISDAERLNRNEEINNNDIYNLQGQRIRSLQKGLNIVNGQKVYVK